MKGMTNINAMWRIKRLTEMFGACGRLVLQNCESMDGKS